MSLHHSPKIITNGLVFHVDPSDKKCYSGSGTVCKDLTNINGNGTLSNVNFSSDKAFVMNSSTSRVYFTRSYANITNSVTFMVTTEIPPIPNSTYPNIMSSDNSNFGGIFIYAIIDPDPSKFISVYIGEDSGNLFDEITYTMGNTYPQKRVIAITIDGTILRLYVDGVLRNISSPRGGGDVNAQSFINLGYASEGFLQTYNGVKIYNSSIYNRPLSQAEILQNYNAIKGRLKS